MVEGPKPGFFISIIRLLSQLSYKAAFDFFCQMNCNNYLFKKNHKQNQKQRKILIIIRLLTSVHSKRQLFQVIRANNATIQHDGKDAAPPIGDVLHTLVITVLSSTSFVLHCSDLLTRKKPNQNTQLGTKRSFQKD